MIKWLQFLNVTQVTPSGYLSIESHIEILLLVFVSTFKATHANRQARALAHAAANTSRCQMYRSTEILINLMHLILSSRSRPRKCSSIQLS